MRILLVEAIETTDRKVLEASYEPIAVLGLAAYLRQQMPSLDIRIIDRDFEDAVDSFRPDLVGIGFVTKNYPVARNYAKIARERGIPVVAGGPHISAAPSTLPEEFDVGVVGEGEQTLLELVRLHEKGKLDDERELSRIAGVVHRTPGGGLETTAPRMLIEDLDALPIPARDLFHSRPHGVASSRGCPFTCSFCFNTHLQKKTRYRSPESVVGEIKGILRDFSPRHINMFDDLFVHPEKRFGQIVDRLVAEGIPKEVWFGCTVRPSSVTPAIARNLGRMNVTMAFLGIESGVQRVLSYLKPQNATVAQNERAIRILNDHGIIVGGGIIIGSPDETEAEILETLEWLKTSGMDIYDVLLLMPLPGTPVWEEAMARGLVSYNMDWSRLDLRANELSGKEPVVMSKTLSWERLNELLELFLAERARFESRLPRTTIRKTLNLLARNPSRIPALLSRPSTYEAAFRLLFGKG